MVITSTGDNTEMGKIAQNLSNDDVSTPLQLKLGKLSATIAMISGIIASILCVYMIIKMNINGDIIITVNKDGATLNNATINGVLAQGRWKRYEENINGIDYLLEVKE